MIKYLLEKEFKQIFRNPILPRIILVLPFVVLAVFPLAANFEIRHLNLSVVDNSHSAMSTALINKIASSGYFSISEVTSSYKKSLESIELNNSDLILNIPAGFDNNLIKDGESKVLISANTVNGVKGGIGSSYLSGIINDYNKEVLSELYPTAAKNTNSNISVKPMFLYNPRLSYPLYMVPALIVMMLSIVCGFLPALNIVLEKENGTIEQLNVTPVNKFIFILSKLIPYWVIGFVVLTICFGVVWLFYGLIPAGSVFTIYLFVAVFVLAFSGFGLVISNYAKSLQQAMFMMFFFIITFIFLSGLYTPVNNMPSWAQAISVISPLKYLMGVMRLIYLKGSGFSELLSPFLYLCGFAVFFNLWAVISYKKI